MTIIASGTATASTVNKREETAFLRNLFFDIHTQDNGHVFQNYRNVIYGTPIVPIKLIEIPINQITIRIIIYQLIL